MTHDISKIRNFAIIAHIDHGKSTLSDRIIEKCHGVSDRDMTNQILDSMDIERERGITIKAQTVRLEYKRHIFNLIDTPGHVDFSYEVNRSLAACNGSILLVDATQGVEAQTLANVYHAISNDHYMIVVLNKVDLPSADVDRVKQQIEEVIGIDTSEAIEVSAKTGVGVDKLLDAIVEKLPSPQQTDSDVLQALIIDSWYDNYLGIVVLMRIMSGTIKAKDTIKMMSHEKSYIVDSVGIFTPSKTPVKELCSGEIGFMTANMKTTSDCRVGDTVTLQKNPCKEALPGFKPTQPMVFCGIFPVNTDEFHALRESIAKLHLNDPSFEYETDSSDALGHGFRCGFLGMLHLEIILERLEREFNIPLITTAPSVIYKVYLTSDEHIAKEIHNPSAMPDTMKIKKIEEPIIKAAILLPEKYVGAVMQLCMEKRGENMITNYAASRIMLECNLPLSEVVFDFYDRLKSVSSGYASLNWEICGYQESDIIRMNILINSEIIDALSCLVHRSRSEQRGREICKRLKTLIPRQMFKIPLQATIGGKIIARETIDALRKDVTAKCYGGDVTRKKKLLEKQKQGKKRMKEFGNVQIPQKAFIDALKVGQDD